MESAMTKAMRRAAFFILLALGAVPCALAQAGPPSTPEPGSIALVGLGLVAGATLLYRSRRNKR